MIGGDGKRAAKAAPAARLLIALAKHYISLTSLAPAFHSFCILAYTAMHQFYGAVTAVHTTAVVLIDMSLQICTMDR